MAARSVLGELACALGRRDEVPNQELAARLVRTNNRAGIRELVEHLPDKKGGIAADALKTLYEVGYRKPELIADHAEAFVPLLTQRNNRLIWGGMMALATVAPLRPDILFKQVARIESATRDGSVITQDNGIRTLAALAAGSERRAARIRPFLLGHLRDCRAKDVPQRAESARPAFAPAAAPQLAALLRERLPELTPRQAARVGKVLRSLEPETDKKR